MADGMDLSLQKAIYEALLAETTITALVGDRIYEEVEENPQFPYIVIGESQEIDDSVQCLDASEIFIDLHVWTNEPGYATNKRISTAIRRVLHNADLVLDEERLVLIEHRITRTFPDEDIIIKHGVVTFRSLTEIVSYEATQP